MADEKPTHADVEGPEESLGEVRDLSHEEAGVQERTLALEQRIADLEAREKDLVELARRVQADFENFRRRAREESAAAATRGKESFLRALLPVLDNLDRALAHAQDEGLRLVSRQLHEALAREGVQVLQPEGDAFDARLHEAIAQETREGAKAGTVLVVVEKGYALDGRVLRPARVVVAA